MAATTFDSSEQKVHSTLDKVKKAGGTKLKYMEDVLFHFT